MVFAAGLAALGLGLNGGKPVQQMRQAFQDRRVSNLPLWHGLTLYRVAFLAWLDNVQDSLPGRFDILQGSVAMPLWYCTG